MPAPVPAPGQSKKPDMTKVKEDLERQRKFVTCAADEAGGISRTCT